MCFLEPGTGRLSERLDDGTHGINKDIGVYFTYVNGIAQLDLCIDLRPVARDSILCCFLDATSFIAVANLSVGRAVCDRCVTR